MTQIWHMAIVIIMVIIFVIIMVIIIVALFKKDKEGATCPDAWLVE